MAVLFQQTVSDCLCCNGCVVPAYFVSQCCNGCVVPADFVSDCLCAVSVMAECVVPADGGFDCLCAVMAECVVPADGGFDSLGEQEPMAEGTDQFADGGNNDFAQEQVGWVNTK